MKSSPPESRIFFSLMVLHGYICFHLRNLLYFIYGVDIRRLSYGFVEQLLFTYGKCNLPLLLFIRQMQIKNTQMFNFLSGFRFIHFFVASFSLHSSNSFYSASLLSSVSFSCILSISLISFVSFSCVFSLCSFHLLFFALLFLYYSGFLCHYPSLCRMICESKIVLSTSICLGTG